MTSLLKQKYDHDGYVLVPDLITSDAQRLALSDACDKVIARTRAGDWSHRRVVGKQFPPYDSAHTDSWGVQHVMHPDLGEPIFAEWYTSDALVKACCELMGCESGELQMELFNLLINPTAHDFALCWHRDDVKAGATAEEEREALNVWHHGVQWNTALHEDRCLYVVPGTHKLPRSPAQRKESNTQDAPADPLDMPGAIQVVLKPGETVFYNSNILHCATYDSSRPRATLHACMGSTRGGSSRARNVLQHGLQWMKEPNFRESLPTERGKEMLDRLLAMERGVGGPVGFSQN